jgi:hypothetical protein
VFKKLLDNALIDPLNEAVAAKKLLDKALVDPLNEAVAVFNCASVANVASNDELNDSKLPIRVLVELV